MSETGTLPTSLTSSTSERNGGVATRMTALIRTLTGVVGLAGLGGGAAAVFETTNEIGTATLLATGFFTLIAALSGELPLNLKAGAIEWSFSSGVKAGAELIATEVEVAAAREGADPVAIARAARSLSSAVATDTTKEPDSRTRARLNTLRSSWKPLSVLAEPTLVELLAWIADRRRQESSSGSSDAETSDDLTPAEDRSPEPVPVRRLPGD